MGFWKRVRLKARELDLNIPEKVGSVLGWALPKIFLTTIVLGWALADSFARQHDLEVVSWLREDTTTVCLIFVVLYSALESVFCMYKALSFEPRKRMFILGRIHLTGGMVATLGAVSHSIYVTLTKVDSMSDKFFRYTALACFAGYGINAIMAIPLLFTVHGHLSSLVRLLATGLFINVVMIANGLCVLYPGIQWPLYVAFPMALLSILFSVSEVVLGMVKSKTKEERRRENHKRGFGPIEALFRKGLQPSYGFFRETVVTRFGFFLGIPPTLCWLYTFAQADLQKIDEIDINITSRFVSAMVFSCWQVSVGTLIATLAMRGAIPYSQFYYLSDDFAVYVPFIGASLLWASIRHQANFVSFAGAFWLPSAA